MTTTPQSDTYQIIGNKTLALIFVLALLSSLLFALFPSVNHDIVFRMNTVTEIILIPLALGTGFSYFSRGGRHSEPLRHPRAGATSVFYFASLYGQWINIMDRIELSHYFEAAMFVVLSLICLAVAIILTKAFASNVP